MTKKQIQNIQFFEVEFLKKKRFDFVKNETLKENIAINMQYIVFLYSLADEYELPGAVIYSTFKTIIIFTASIVESLINYKLNEMIKSGQTKEDLIMDKEDKYLDCKELYKISNMEKICGVKKIIKFKKLTCDTNFIDLNKAAKRSGLFTEELYEKSDKIRKARNRLHPYSLEEVDDKYSKKDINNIFSMASEIINRIENY